MKFQSDTKSYGQCQFMTKAQLSVQERGLRKVLVQEQALHCFSPRSDGLPTKVHTAALEANSGIHIP